ncbi:oligosaccharide repeat unit polymerase [Pseudoalteromonas sp. MB41]|uniref:O-antigen polymerase n=1 Tax=Pseudoalteromonas sp. MB41 TaxID=2896366 RepID=UPI001E5D69E6|nr:O-antigen polymerase [Pseudoalteromonas sp. MB41]MCC9661797.1 oligosaccharide repeat unit polymerase [Pseudoalteromonas sp. MB41]
MFNYIFTLRLAVLFLLLIVLVFTIGDVLVVNILGISLVCFILVLAGVVENNDWKSPLVYFPIVFMLYHIVFPIYFYLGGDRTYGVSLDSVISATTQVIIFLSGMVFSYLLSPIGGRKGTVDLLRHKVYYFGITEIKIIFFLFIALYLYSYVQLLSALGMSKEQRMISGVISFSVFFGGVYFCYLYIMNSLIVKTGFFNKSLFLFVITLGFFGFIFFGERDQLVLPIVASFFLYSYYKPVSFKRVLLFGCSIFFLLFLLGIVRESLEGTQLREISSLVSVLEQNEFISTGRNLALVNDSNIQHLYGLTYLGDLGYSFFIKANDTGLQWFESNYVTNKGFSIVAEAYVNFGLVGVFSLGFLIMSLMLYFYRKSFGNNISMIIYIILVVAFLYCIRSDFGAVFSAAVKKIGIPLSLLVIARLYNGKVYIYSRRKV